MLTPEERNQMQLDMMSWFNGDTEFLEDPACAPDRDLFCAGWKAAHARGKESNTKLTGPAPTEDKSEQ